ncbi:hypothetical protein JW968_03560 [Candidatus Woesearchaeota archaeon]|nr:hypothetical protein [Candidatus Woesearchaeota archaeon]
MTWKKISDSGDLKIFEKSSSRLNIRIEARLTDRGWEIYKNYNDGENNKLIEEYAVENEKELDELMESLKRDRDLSEKDIDVINRLKKAEHKFAFKRLYKGNDSEKWSIVVNGGNENFVLVKYGENLVIDLLLHEKYRFIAERFMDEIYKTLIDDDSALKITENIHYFTKSTTRREELPKNVYVNNIEMTFGDL